MITEFAVVHNIIILAAWPIFGLTVCIKLTNDALNVAVSMPILEYYALQYISPIFQQWLRFIDWKEVLDILKPWKALYKCQSFLFIFNWQVFTVLHKLTMWDGIPIKYQPHLSFMYDQPCSQPFVIKLLPPWKFPSQPNLNPKWAWLTVICLMP